MDNFVQDYNLNELYHIRKLMKRCLLTVSIALFGYHMIAISACITILTVLFLKATIPTGIPIVSLMIICLVFLSKLVSNMKLEYEIRCELLLQVEMAILLKIKDANIAESKDIE